MVRAASSKLIVQCYQEGKKRYFYPLNQDTTAASAGSTTIGGERGAGAFNFEPVGPGTYMTTNGVVFPDSVPGRATFRGGDPAVGVDLQVGPRWRVNS